MEILSGVFYCFFIFKKILVIVSLGLFKKKIKLLNKVNIRNDSFGNNEN